MTIVLAIVGGLLALLVIAGYASPRVATLTRSIDVAAPPSDVFPRLNTLQRFVDEWSPWTPRDPDARHTYNDVPSGVGARYAWVGHPKKVGAGSMTILESEENALVRTKLVFKGRGMATATWRLEPLDGGARSRVHWDFASDAGNNPFGRLVGRFIERFLAPDYEDGLARLKAAVEGAA